MDKQEAERMAIRLCDKFGLARTRKIDELVLRITIAIREAYRMGWVDGRKAE